MDSYKTSPKLKFQVELCTSSRTITKGPHPQITFVDHREHLLPHRTSLATNKALITGTTRLGTIRGPQTTTMAQSLASHTKKSWR